MNVEADEQAAREAGARYGTMAADLSLVHISLAVTDEAVEHHIADLALNIGEQAQQRARDDIGKILPPSGGMPPSKQLRPVSKPMESLRRPKTRTPDTKV